MDSYIIHPQTKAQEKALKAVLEALKVDFECLKAGVEEQLPDVVVQKVKKSQQQIAEGKFISLDEMKAIISKRK
jgi:hypothetical protein